MAQPHVIPVPGWADDLRARLAASMAEVDEKAQIDRDLLGPVDADRCQYCRRHFRSFAKSRFPGHVKCCVTFAFRMVLVGVMEADYTITLDRVATELDVTTAVVRAWVSHRWGKIK